MRAYTRKYKGELYVLLNSGNGEECLVFILKDRNLRQYAGGVFTSPSAAAKAITGYAAINGRKFFGMVPIS